MVILLQDQYPRERDPVVSVPSEEKHTSNCNILLDVSQLLWCYRKRTKRGHIPDHKQSNQEYARVYTAGLAKEIGVQKGNQRP